MDVRISASCMEIFKDNIEDRCQLHSTLVTSQHPVNAWHALFEEPTVADAIMDRLIHDAYRTELKGDTMRKSRSRIKNTEVAVDAAAQRPS